MEKKTQRARKSPAKPKKSATREPGRPFIPQEERGDRPGRPSLPEAERGNRYNVYLSKDVASWARQIGDDSLSRGLSVAVEEKARRMGLLK